MTSVKCSFHNHTGYSDGYGTPEEMIKKAVGADFTHYAFTDHIYCPYDSSWTLSPDTFDIYTDHIARIKDEYGDKMLILTGIEADWYRGTGTEGTGFEELSEKLDFVVGSVHFLNPGSGVFIIDGSEKEFEVCLRDGFGGNIRNLVTYYYESYMEMAEGLRPDLMAHPDIIRKNNISGFFDETESWYTDLIGRCAKTLAKYNLVTEVNGGGNYRYRNNVIYPSEPFMKFLKDENVRITIGLDAHSTDMLTDYYDFSAEYLLANGYSSFCYFEGGIWKDCSLE